MKVDGTSKVGGSGDLSPKKTDKPGTTSFDSVLKEVLTEKTAKTVAPIAPLPIQSVSTAPKVGNSINLLAVGELESLVDDLTIYKGALENQDIPKGHIRPLADSLKEKKEELVSLLKVVDDPELRSILTQAAALVADENNRFHASSY